MQYKILVARAKNTVDINDVIVELEKLVNKEMENGWRPQGGVNLDSLASPSIYVYVVAQAMVKED